MNESEIEKIEPAKLSEAEIQRMTDELMRRIRASGLCSADPEIAALEKKVKDEMQEALNGLDFSSYAYDELMSAIGHVAELTTAYRKRLADTEAKWILADAAAGQLDAFITEVIDTAGAKTILESRAERRAAALHCVRFLKREMDDEKARWEMLFGRGAIIRKVRVEYAAMRPDGQIAGDGEVEVTAATREALQKDLERWEKNTPGYLRELNGLHDGQEFRIAKIHVVEAESGVPSGD